MGPRTKSTTKTLVLAASKGGVGKTTLASALAVRAAADGKRVALVDTDPQASLDRWWEMRGSPENPQMFDADANLETLELIRAEGWDWLVIDTPPAMFDRIEAAIYIADFVLVPCRASAFDIDAVAHVVELCETHGTNFAFVTNAAHPQWTKMVEGAEGYLKTLGPVLSERIGFRKDYAAAVTIGKSGPEIGKDGKARSEIDALWATVKRSASKVAPK